MNLIYLHLRQKDNDKEIEIGSHSEKNSSEAEKKNVNVYSARVGGKNGVKMIILPKAESAEVEFSDLLYGAIYNSCIKNNQKREHGGKTLFQ